MHNIMKHQLLFFCFRAELFDSVGEKMSVCYLASLTGIEQERIVLRNGKKTTQIQRSKRLSI